MKLVLSRHGAGISLVLVALSLSYLLNLTWLKWGDLITDTGRELYVPLAITQGRVLYRDIFYIYGPLSPYLNAFLFSVFGVHVLTLALGGFVAAILASLLIYRLARIYLEELLAGFTALTFVFVFAFSHYGHLNIFTFLLPYSYPAVHGTVFCLAGLYFFHQYLSRGRAVFLQLTNFLVLLTLLTKIEMGAWLLLSLVAGLFLYEYSTEKNRLKAAVRAVVSVTWPLLGALLIYIVWNFISEGMIFGDNFADVATSNFQTNNSFAARLLGTDRLAENSLILFGKVAQFVAISALFLFGGVMLEKNQQGSGTRLLRWGRTAAAVFALVAGVALSRLFSDIYLHYRALPFSCLVVTLYFLAKNLLRGRDDQGPKVNDIFLATLALFSTLLSSRIFFRASAVDYGFYLLVPGMVVTYILMFRLLPDRLNLPVAKRFVQCAFVLTALFVVGDHHVYARESFLNINYKIQSARGTLFFKDNNQTRRYHTKIEELSATATGKSMVAMPEGVMLNFLSGLDSPLYYNLFLPVDLKHPRTIESIIAEMDAKKPDYIFLTDRDYSVYGYTGLVEYALPIMEYIRDNYQIEFEDGYTYLLHRR